MNIYSKIKELYTKKPSALLSRIIRAGKGVWRVQPPYYDKIFLISSHLKQVKSLLVGTGTLLRELELYFRTRDSTLIISIVLGLSLLILVGGTSVNNLKTET